MWYRRASPEMSGQHYCLRWNNYQSNMTSVFHHLLRSQAFVDVTLACNHQSLKAHKVVLSACSSYFQKLLMENPCKHPTIIMPQDICFSDLKFIIEFVYRGEIDVSQAELQSLLKTADQLKIKGLCEVPESKGSQAEVTALSSSPRRHRYRTKRRLHDIDQEMVGECVDAATSTDGDMKLGDEESRCTMDDDDMGELTDGMGSPDPHNNQPMMDDSQNVDALESKENLIVPLSLNEMATEETPNQNDIVPEEIAKIKFENFNNDPEMLNMRRDSNDGSEDGLKEDGSMQTMMITPELLGLLPTHSDSVNGGMGDNLDSCPKPSKNWSNEDMEAALDALRNQTMSLTKASLHFGIPSTTLWQRAHRLGIDTPKKDGPAKSWTEDNLNIALDALRSGTISANKASKAYGIPSSTLYKIARREGIRLAAPFNAAPTTWNPDDLERALEAIRSGQTTVQRAAADYGIPSGTLYGRCKREGIGLTRNNPTPWSEQAMNDALESVRIGQMSINQAAIHYNLPYSSLYGRFKRVKYEGTMPNSASGEPLDDSPPQQPNQPPQQPPPSQQQQASPPVMQPQQIMLVQYQQAATPTAVHMYTQPTT